MSQVTRNWRWIARKKTGALPVAVGVAAIALAGLAAPAQGATASSAVPRSGCDVTSYYGVSAVSATDGWVVGTHSRTACSVYYGLIQRWNGQRWQAVASPQPGDPSTSCGVALYSVTALSAGDAWAGGMYCPPGSSNASRSLIEHWNGKKWGRVPSLNPNPNGVNKLMTVEAVAPDDVWAVGYSCPLGLDVSARPTGDASGSSAGPPEGCQSLVERFNGTSWKRVRPQLAAFVQHVAGPSSDDVWASGYLGSGEDSHAVVRRFDGHHWTQVYTSSQPGTTAGAIDWISDDDVWIACGGFADRKDMMHWDGTSWHRVRLRGHQLMSSAGLVSGSSASAPWAVGTSGNLNLLEQWDGSRWAPHHYPNQSQGIVIRGLTASYPDFTWAVGSVDVDYGGVDGVLLHWTGSRWVDGS